MRFKLPLIIGAFATLLAGCGEETPYANRTYVATRGSIQPLLWASRTGAGVPVFVANAAFGSAHDSATRFVDSLNTSAKDPNFRFTAVGEPLELEGTRILAVFDPPVGKSAISFCQGIYPTPVRDEEVLHFRIAVCKGDRRVVEVVARMKRPLSSTDPDFAELRKLAGRLLFEREDKTPR